MRMAVWMVGVFLAGVAGARAATELTSGAQVVFQASGNATFGAAYSERAVKATVVSPVPVAVSVQTGRKPRSVFLGQQRLSPEAWRYDDAKGMVGLALPAGTSELQLRFDELTDLNPFQAPVPLTLVGAAGAGGADLGTVALTVAGEKVLGSWPWAGADGLYRVRAMRGEAEAAGVAVEASSRGSDGSLFLQAGTVVSVRGDAPAQKLPLDRLECRLLATVVPTRKIAREALPWADSVVVEGEAFKAEGGGAVSRSTEHGNTHGGGCIYAWGNPGHWIAWDVPVPAAGDYVLTVVMASQEADILRSLSIDGTPAAGASMLRFAGTGGWGRSNPDEWQAAQPVDAQGQPVRFRLQAGTRELRLENVFGQHMNVDCLVLTPAR